MSEPISATKTVTAQNTFTDAVQLDEGEVASISIACDVSWVGTIQVQRRLPGQSSFQNVQPYLGGSGFTASAEIDYQAPASQEIRVGCPTGSYSAGTATLFIRTGR